MRVVSCGGGESRKVRVRPGKLDVVVRALANGTGNLALRPLAPSTAEHATGAAMNKVAYHSPKLTIEAGVLIWHYIDS